MKYNLVFILFLFAFTSLNLNAQTNSLSGTYTIVKLQFFDEYGNIEDEFDEIDLLCNEYFIFNENGTVVNETYSGVLCKEKKELQGDYSILANQLTLKLEYTVHTYLITVNSSTDLVLESNDKSEIIYLKK